MAQLVQACEGIKMVAHISKCNQTLPGTSQNSFGTTLTPFKKTHTFMCWSCHFVILLMFKARARCMEMTRSWCETIRFHMNFSDKNVMCLLFPWISATNQQLSKRDAKKGVWRPGRVAPTSPRLTPYYHPEHSEICSSIRRYALRVTLHSFQRSCEVKTAQTYVILTNWAFHVHDRCCFSCCRLLRLVRH